MRRLQDPLSWQELKLAWEEEERKKNQAGVNSFAPAPCGQVGKATRGFERSVEVGHIRISALVLISPHPNLSNRTESTLRGKNEPAKAAVVELGRYGRQLRRQRHQ